MKYEMKNEIIITNHQQWFVRYMWPSMHTIEPTFSAPPPPPNEIRCKGSCGA